MTQAVKPDPRRHPLAHIGFCFAVAISDAARNVGIAEPDRHRARFYRRVAVGLTRAGR